MKALLLSAGFGTRLKPFTEKHPKALAKVNGKSILEINIRNLQRFGIFDIIVNVHHFSEQIIEVLKKANGFDSRIEISDENDAILETGGGLKNAAPLLAEEKTFLVMNVDVISNFNLDKMLKQHFAKKPLVTLAVQKRVSSRFLLFDNKDRLCGWGNRNTGEKKIPIKIENTKKSFHELAFSGIQLLEHNILNKIKQSGKFSLMEVYLSLCATENIMAWNHTNDIWIDVGKPEKLREAEILCASFI